jgi:hypothetical protein
MRHSLARYYFTATDKWKDWPGEKVLSDTLKYQRSGRDIRQIVSLIRFSQAKIGYEKVRRIQKLEDGLSFLPHIPEMISRGEKVLINTDKNYWLIVISSTLLEIIKTVYTLLYREPGGNGLNPFRAFCHNRRLPSFRLIKLL